MKKFARDLNSEMHELLNGESDIDFLHCNVHFLLSRSQSCETVLKTFERTMEVKLGRDNHIKFLRFISVSESATCRLIRTACAVLGPKGDQKNGCRIEWLAFCEEQEVPSKLPSSRSNRFNCIFEADARLVQYLGTVRLFLGEHILTHDNLLIDSVRKDAAYDNLMTLVTVLAALYVLFTEPFWRLIQSKTSLAGFSDHVQKLNRSLINLTADAPILISQISTSASAKPSPWIYI